MKSSMIIHPDEISKKWIDKLALCGVSTLGIHPSGGKDSVLSLTNLVKNLKTREYRELIDYAYEKGLTVEYEFHAAGYLLPRGLFSEHPEYFRVNKDGERTKDCNLCPSSKEAVGIF